MKMDMPPKGNNGEKEPIFLQKDLLSKDENNNDISNTTERYIKIPLTEEELNMTADKLAQKYDIGRDLSYESKKRKYLLIDNSNYISDNKRLIKEQEEIKKYIEEITPVQISSIETIFTNKEEQKIVKEIVEKYNSLNFRVKDIGNRNGKRFILMNGKELTAGDFVILDRLINFKVFRAEDGKLMMYKNGEDKPSLFSRSKFFDKNNTYFFKDKSINIDSNQPKYKTARSLESFSPEVFNLGLFKEEDFDRNYFGSESYDVLGPHERSLSKSSPYVDFSNSDGRCRYYIGRDKFNGKDKKINHETVKVSLLDNNTGVITDVINGRKVILYTFPLLNKEEGEKMREEIIKRRISENKPVDTKTVNDFITKKTELKEYLITDYIFRNSNESDIDYANRISKLSDTSYVLGNFRSFMSETGLAANNYSWKEQLILSDALTSVEENNKIISFGKNFKKDGVKTFLSIEQGGKEMGDKIIGLGEKLPEEVSQKVFEKYGEIINTADKAEEEIKNIFGNIDISDKVLVSVKETLLKRGQKMLSDLGDKILDKNFKVNEQEILNELEDIKSETIVLGESYIKFYKEGIKVPIEDVTQIEQISTQDLTEDEKKELLKVYENGRPKITYENKEHLELLKEEFKQELENKDTLVFNIRFNGDIIIFAIVDKKDKDTLYIGGLTFTDEVRNPVIAEASMNCVLEKFKDYNIKALVDSRNPILSMYQKRFGFKIVGELPREENAGELYYEIEKSRSVEEKIMKIREELEKAA